MVGETISHYRVVDKLGQGGMGEVFLAQDTSLDRKVALKFLPEQWRHDPTARKRFLREAKSAAALDHPYICKVYETAEVDDTSFIAMEYVPGQTLMERLSEGPLALSEALQTAVEVAEALEEAHGAGIVHRDLKPSNIMLRPEGHVKVMDFGLAKGSTEGEDDQEQTVTQLTQSGATVGTPAYMSPEQLRGQPLDARSDIFSFGVMLYEMATGMHPFKRDTQVDTAHAILSQDPPPLTDHTERMGSLQPVIEKMVDKEPEQRYQSIQEVRTDLSQVLSGSTVGKHVRPGRAPSAGALWKTVAALVLIVVAFLGWWFFPGETTPAIPERISSIAVLPLDNVSGDPEQAYFAAGMHEALITDLSKIGALKVISRRSVLRYREMDKSIPEIALELGVDAVITGGVLPVGDQVRITAQLIDGKTDESLWAESYNRGLRDVLVLQSEVARAIAGEIKIAVTAEEEARLAEAQQVDPEVHDLYLKGRYHWNDDEFEKSVEYFQEALRIDPDFALAHASLADTYIVWAHQGMAPKRAYPQAQSAALKALGIDDSLAQAHVALADAKYHYDWDWEGAEEGFQRAFDLNPSYATGHWWYSGLLAALGRFEEAITEIKLAQTLEPLSIRLHGFAVWVRYLARQHDEAIAAFKTVVDLDPNASQGLLGVIYQAKGMHQQAAEVFEKAALKGNVGAKSSLAQAYARGGRKIETLQLLRELEELYRKRYFPAMLLAEGYASLGEKDQAFLWLDKAAEARDAGLIWVNVDARYDPLRSDPRFTDLLRRMGLE